MGLSHPFQPKEGHWPARGVGVLGSEIRANSATPLERPEALAGRARLTDEEVAALQERGDRIFGDGRSSFAGATNAFRAALENVETYNNLAAPSSSVAMVPLEFDNRTSLVLEPPDGRIPR